MMASTSTSSPSRLHADVTISPRSWPTSPLFAMKPLPIAWSLPAPKDVCLCTVSTALQTSREEQDDVLYGKAPS